MPEPSPSGGPKRTGFESVLRAMDHQEFRPVSIDLLVPLRTVDGGRHVLIPVYQIHTLGEFGRHGVRIQLQGILIEAQAHPQALVVCVALLSMSDTSTPQSILCFML